MTTGIKHLYVHVPFCKTICYYCDFCHRIYNEKIADQWLNQLQKEIDELCKDSYETIYIGGGTPSCLSLKQLERLLNMLLPFSSQVIEYTFEVNPESIDQTKIEILKRYGVNRISMGIQTSDDALLKALGRRHSFGQAKEKIELLKKNGLNNISVDLMYSLPGQRIEILKKSLNDILSLHIPHISLYSLTVEENTVFGKKGVQSLDDDTEADMYELIQKVLSGYGYINYEISNFCLSGFQSRHNLAYWNYEDFLGISSGASSKIGNHRYTNTFSLKSYLEDYRNRKEDLFLDKREQMFEHIMMSLRTIYGLDIDLFNHLYECDFLKEYIDALKDENLTIIDGKLLCLKPAILNQVLLKFMD